MPIPLNDIEAVSRGLCIHQIRAQLKARHDHTYSSRKRTRLAVRIQVEQMRALGPGRVILPERCGGGILGPAMECWG